MFFGWEGFYRELRLWRCIEVAGVDQEQRTQLEITSGKYGAGGALSSMTRAATDRQGGYRRLCDARCAAVEM